MNETGLALFGNTFLAPATTLDTITATYAAKAMFIKEILVENTDYGKVPGAGDKKTLLKPGAEKLMSFFGLTPTFEDIEKVEDWTGRDHDGEPFFYYREKCNLLSGPRLIASADGSCNSFEKKYRYRQADIVCPTCGKNTIIKGKEEYGGGFLCFAKKGGCGAKFPDNDKRITEQPRGQVKNPDVAEQVNTILKMAQKRALVAATLIATNASDYFTQDVEDYDYGSREFVDTTFRDAPPEPPHQPSGMTATPANAIDTSKMHPIQPPAPVTDAPKQAGEPQGETPAPVTQSHDGEDYANMSMKDLTGRHAHYSQLSRQTDKKGGNDVSRAQAKATADYLETLIKAKRASN